MKVLQQHIEQIKALCTANKVDSLFAFGSVTTNAFTEQSDVDLLVDIHDSDPISYTEKYFEIKFKLQEILNRKIDLLEQKSLKNKYLIQEIDQTKVLIYGT